MFRSRNIKWFLIVLVMFILASVVYAFAASNTVTDSKAGDGSGTITGFAVTNVVYTLNPTDPTTLQTVTFTLDSAAGTVKLCMVGSGTPPAFTCTGSWYPCTVTGGTSVSCTIGGAVTVLAANALEVVAIQ